jgi:acid stress-induced BolA-like protein IbaG/YrbA
MALRILNSPGGARDLTDEIRRAIAGTLPDARIEVVAASPGHFAIRVVSSAFAGRSRVAQQQLVYGAIAHLMQGDAAPVHAIDRLQTELP